jgi:2-iminobutanoate/2-iminopropanoate deaminase
MIRRILTPKGVEAPKSPLSPGIRWGDLVFVSGQTAPEATGVEAQTRAVLEKIGAILRAGGTDHGNVLRCGVYLADIRTFDAMNAVYREVFKDGPPARSTIECKMASAAILVEIDCVAGVPQA